MINTLSKTLEAQGKTQDIKQSPSMKITPTAFVVWPPPCTGGNKARGVSAGSLIVKTLGSIRERLTGRHVGDPLACGEGPRLSTELLDQELGPYEGFLVRGSNKD